MSRGCIGILVVILSVAGAAGSFGAAADTETLEGVVAGVDTAAGILRLQGGPAVRVDPAAAVQRGGRAVRIADLRAGDRVRLVVSRPTAISVQVVDGPVSIAPRGGWAIYRPAKGMPGQPSNWGTLPPPPVADPAPVPVPVPPAGGEPGVIPQGPPPQPFPDPNIQPLPPVPGTDTGTNPPAFPPLPGTDAGANLPFPTVPGTEPGADPPVPLQLPPELGGIIPPEIFQAGGNPATPLARTPWDPIAAIRQATGRSFEPLATEVIAQRDRIAKNLSPAARARLDAACEAFAKGLAAAPGPAGDPVTGASQAVAAACPGLAAGAEFDVLGLYFLSETARRLEPDVLSLSSQKAEADGKLAELREKVRQQKNVKMGVSGDLKREVDTAGGLSSELQMRLQLLMDRRQKIVQTLSNIMGKASKTADALIQNIK
ncbi:MAG: hypothetical protein AAB215_01980 [Planctomycetota bacterium]